MRSKPIRKKKFEPPIKKPAAVPDLEASTADKCPMQTPAEVESKPQAEAAEEGALDSAEKIRSDGPETLEPAEAVPQVSEESEALDPPAGSGAAPEKSAKIAKLKSAAPGTSEASAEASTNPKKNTALDYLLEDEEDEAEPEVEQKPELAGMLSSKPQVEPALQEAPTTNQGEKLVPEPALLQEQQEDPKEEKQPQESCETDNGVKEEGNQVEEEGLQTVVSSKEQLNDENQNLGTDSLKDPGKVHLPSGEEVNEQAQLATQEEKHKPEPAASSSKKGEPQKGRPPKSLQKTGSISDLEVEDLEQIMANSDHQDESKKQSAEKPGGKAEALEGANDDTQSVNTDEETSSTQGDDLRSSQAGRAGSKRTFSQASRLWKAEKGIPVKHLAQYYTDLSSFLCHACQGILVSPMACQGCQKLHCKGCVAGYECCDKPEQGSVGDTVREGLRMLKFKCSTCKKARRYLHHLDHLSIACRAPTFKCSICSKFEGPEAKRNEHMNSCISEFKNQNSFLNGKLALLEQENQFLRRQVDTLDRNLREASQNSHHLSNQNQHLLLRLDQMQQSQSHPNSQSHLSQPDKPSLRPQTAERIKEVVKIFQTGKFFQSLKKDRAQSLTRVKNEVFSPQILPLNNNKLILLLMGKKRVDVYGYQGYYEQLKPQAAMASIGNGEDDPAQKQVSVFTQDVMTVAHQSENLLFLGCMSQKIEVITAENFVKFKRFATNANPSCYCQLSPSHILVGCFQGHIAYIDTKQLLYYELVKIGQAVNKIESICKLQTENQIAIATSNEGVFIASYLISPHTGHIDISLVKQNGQFLQGQNVRFMDEFAKGRLIAFIDGSGMGQIIERETATVREFKMNKYEKMIFFSALKLPGLTHHYVIKHKNGIKIVNPHLQRWYDLVIDYQLDRHLQISEEVVPLQQSEPSGPSRKLYYLWNIVAESASKQFQDKLLAKYDITEMIEAFQTSLV